MTDPQKNWEAIARTAPYFGVLTDPRFLDVATPGVLAEFFASGAADVDSLFRTISAHVVADFSPRDVLDFGCGVGRLTLSLARHAVSVIGLDSAPSMVSLASRHAQTAGLSNVQFLASDVDLLGDASFDLIVSLLVFQHIPVRRGMRILRTLLRKLRPGGVAAIHLTVHRRGGRFRRVARWIRSRFNTVHVLAQLLQRDERRLPYMEMNEYDLNAVVRELHGAGCVDLWIEATNHGGIQGALLTTRKKETKPTLA